MWILSTPEVNLRLILRMCGGNNNVNRQFQGEKSENGNISETVNPINSISRPSWDAPELHFVGGLILPTRNPLWLPAAVFINGYDVITQPWIDGFGRNLVRP